MKCAATLRSDKDGRRLWGDRHASHRVCRSCGRDLPIECFERYPSGTYRHVCRRCRYLNTEKPYRRRRILTDEKAGVTTRADDEKLA